MTLEALFGLSGKTVLITGATGGIGSAMVEAFATAGARLVLTSNDEAACQIAAAALRERGASAWAMPCDVGQSEQLDALADDAQQVAGPVDVLVCNAGISGHFGPMHTADAAARDTLFSVNLNHALQLTSRIAPRMAASGKGGSIVLTASIAGLRGNAGVGLYGLTKAALIQLARNLAVEWGPKGVRANAIAPGLIATGWADAILANPQASDRRLSLTPLRRIGLPGEVASAALFLAGPGAGFITGQTLVVDGGTLITDGN
ncbi:MAG TPA: glucose 1-dehydrogenase [Novosphingobium sp.]|nr:glucose 1-dehydrogenase [Novosphingobium sp.]